MARHVKVTGVQMACSLGNVPKNIKKATRLIVKAGRSDPDFICLPELFSTGYVLHERFKECAEPVNGPTFQKLKSLAGEIGCYIIAGIPEASSAQIHNSALIVGPGGELVGNSRKIHLPFDADSMEKRYFTPGNQADVFETKAGKIGVEICYDLVFPEVSRALAVKGAELLFVIAAWETTRIHVWDTLTRARAIENGLFLVGVNRVGREKGISFPGRSVIVNPLGEVIVRHRDSEGLMNAEIDLDEIARIRHEVTYFTDRIPRLDASLMAAENL
jgi:predicted amidohydrolase